MAQSVQAKPASKDVGASFSAGGLSAAQSASALNGAESVPGQYQSGIWAGAETCSLFLVPLAT